MRKVLVVDYEKCTGCEVCVLYCSFAKTQTFSRSRSRVNVIRWEEEGICVPSMCAHCDEAPCVLIRPVNALTKNAETGIVEMDKDRCIGCKSCVMVCPFGAPSIDPVNGAVFKCDMCGGDPVCARVCPTGAIQYLPADRVSIARKRDSLSRLPEIARMAQKAGGGDVK